MTTLYIVRHGETDLNRRGCFCGSSDYPLNERGIAQAETLREPMSKVAFDRIYASPLKRAKKTAECIRNGRDIEIIDTDGIREIDCGKWETLNRDEIEARWPGEIEFWASKPHLLHMEGGETFDEVQERVIRTVIDIVNRERGNTVALACHMLVIQLIMTKLLGAPICDTWKVLNTPTNTSVTVIEVDDNGDFEIVRWSDDSHLPPELKDPNIKVTKMDDEIAESKYGLANAMGKHHFEEFAVK